MLGDGGRQPVIDPLGDRDRHVGAEFLGRGRGVRNHLHVDAGLVHFLEAKLAEVEQALGQFRLASGVEAGEQGGELRVPIVLFQRDDRTLRLLQHWISAPGEFGPRHS